jgi:hypothetical protein
MRCSTYKPNTKYQIAKRLLFGFWFLVFALPLQACPYCKETIEGIAGMAKGFSWSVILMLAVPLVVVLIISGVVVKAYRKATPR